MSRSTSSWIAGAGIAGALLAGGAGGACLSSDVVPCGAGFCATGELCVDGRCGFCGDGVEQGGEECDLGEANSMEPDAPCRPDCQTPSCGDGVIDPGRDEVCDEGAQNSDVDPDRCRASDCKPARCGDGVEDSGEEGGCLEPPAELGALSPSPGLRVVPADLDQDGLTDLIVLERDVGRLIVRWATPSGWEAAVELPVSMPVDFLVGELDSAGGRDLLVRTGGETPQLVPVTVHDRTFNLHAAHDLQPTDRFVVLGHLDLVSGNDLVIVGQLALGPANSYALYFRGDGAGGFLDGFPAVTLPAGAVGVAYRHHPGGDLGIIDVVLQGSQDNVATLAVDSVSEELELEFLSPLGTTRLNVELGPEAQGGLVASGFVEPGPYPSLLMVTPGATEYWRPISKAELGRGSVFAGTPVSTTFVDLTGDRVDEGVIGSASPAGEFGVQLVANDGAGFHPTPMIALPIRPLELASGDLDHDGVADLVVGDALAPRVLVMRGGDGPFGVSTRIPVDTFLATDLVVGPLGGQAGADVVRSGALGVFLYEDPAIPGRVISSNLSTTPTKRVFIADVDADGRNDVVSWTDFGELVLHRKGDDVGFVREGGLDCEGDDVVIASASGDPTLDAVCWGKDGSVLVFPGGASGFDKAPKASQLGLAADGLALADVDGDGHDDLLVASPAGVYAARNQGAGTFDPAVALLGEPALRALPAHVDRDGQIDLVVMTADGAEVQVYLGRGFAAPVLASRHATTSEPPALATTDFNGDGAADLFFGDAGAPARALFGRGDGTFARPARAAADRAIIVRVGDVTGDGNADVVWSDGNDAFFLPSRLEVK